MMIALGQLNRKKTSRPTRKKNIYIFQIDGVLNETFLFVGMRFKKWISLDGVCVKTMPSFMSFIIFDLLDDVLKRVS